MNELTYIQLARLENGELWLLKETPQGYQKHRKIKEIIDGEIIENKSETIVS